MTSIPNPDPDRRYTPRPRAFERPDENAGMHEARELFFQAVHDIEPRVAGDLMGEPLELFRPLFDQAIAHLPEDQRDYSWRYFDIVPGWGRFKYAGERDAEAVHRLKAWLQRWADNWWLKDEWCLEAAVDTLADFSAGGDNPRPTPLVYCGGSLIGIPFREDETRFEFSHSGWMLTIDGWEHYREGVTHAFKRELNAYRRRLERMAEEEADLRRVPGTRHRKGDRLNWLARWQVGREHWTEIARAETERLRLHGDDEGVSRQAVQQAADSAARFIGLERRPGK